jgi:hypothetical protein
MKSNEQRHMSGTPVLYRHPSVVRGAGAGGGDDDNNNHAAAAAAAAATHLADPAVPGQKMAESFAQGPLGR